MFADDQTLPTQPVVPPVSSAADPADPAVDEVVQMGSDVQQTFVQNDQATAVAAANPVAPVDPVAADPVATTPADPAVPLSDDLVDDTVSPPPAESGKNPLDILEEILNEREKEAATEAKPVSTEPTPEELEKQRIAVEEEKRKTEEVRQQMHAEVTSPEQKTRDDIRVQQANSLKTDNPFEIKQLEHKRVG